MSKAAINIIVYGLTGILLAMLIVRLMPVQCREAVIQEGFQNKGPNTNTKCPTGTKTFTDRGGNLMCCKGQVNGGVCEGSIVCSFSSTTGRTIPFCQ